MEDNFKYAMLYDITKNFSSLLQMVNFVIESRYKINVERISRTEKNKGGDYSSTSYTVTANLESIENSSLNSIFLGKRYNLVNSSSELLGNIFEEKVKYFETPILIDEKIKNFSDFGLNFSEKNQIISMGGVKYKIPFLNIKIVGLNKDPFILDSMEQSLYLSQVTRFMEIFGNVVLNLEEYIQIYEFWLWKIFKKYFRHEITEY